MNKELHRQILNEKLNEVARERGYSDWAEFIFETSAIEAQDAAREAALLAMEEVSKFEIWIYQNGWASFQNKFVQDVGSMTDLTELKTELELYQIYKESPEYTGSKEESKS